MSKLSAMIKELCPDGVEYKKLGEIATNFFRGAGIKRDELTETGIPCVRYGEIYTTYGLYFDTCISYTDASLLTNPKYFEHGDILFAVTGESVEEIAKSTAYIGYEKCVAGGDIVVLQHQQDPKYLSYVLSTEMAQRQKSRGRVKSKVVHSNVPAIKKIEIPVPPLAIQQEIVKLLDNFTELTAELTAELTLRKKQYSFYRDSLLNFSRDDVDDTASSVAETPHYMVGDIFNIQNGYTPSKKEDTYWENGTIPWYRLEDIRTQGRILYDAIQHVHSFGVKGNLYPTKSLLMSTTATIGEYALLMTPSLSNQQMTNFAIKKEFEDVLDVKFAFYYFHVFAEWCKKNANQSGGMPIITTGKLKIFSFPIPPLETQAKIVSILDRFDVLCHDLVQGLPAEIAARKKQYEYYRDKLLTFPRKGESTRSAQ